MTDFTPAQARELANEYCPNEGVAVALRSLADQVEALTAENASILRASLYSADLATQAMEDVKTLTTERDALLQANLTHITEFGELQGWALSHPKSNLADSGVIAALVVFATVLDPRDLRVFLQSLQAGEMSVSRAVEILDMWLVGKYSDDQVPPPPADSALIVDDKFPMELVRELRAELADLRAAAPVVPAPVALAWLPIETAPQDGTLIDIWRPSWGGERCTDMQRFDLGGGNVFYSPKTSGPSCVRDATHWMPLPPAPGATPPQAAPVAQLSEPPEADMFWNNDDPERCADSIHEVLEWEWQDGILQVGDIRTIQQAMKMPNVRVRVTSAKNDEDGFDYDFIEPAAKPQQTMFDDLPRPENCGTGHCSCIECPFAAAPTTPKE